MREINSHLILATSRSVCNYPLELLWVIYTGTGDLVGELSVLKLLSPLQRTIPDVWKVPEQLRD